MSDKRRRTAAISLGAVVLAAVASCSSDGDAVTPTPAISAAAGEAYSTTAFVVPLTLTVDPALKSPPDPSGRNLVSWDAVASDQKKVRLMVPLELYRPGRAQPEAVPEDYLAYLQGLATDGVAMSEVGTTTVDGRPATLLTVTSTVDAKHPDGFLDGALGCPAAGADHAEGCYGPQPDLALRLAVIDADGPPLLAWARTSKDEPDPSFVAGFERMLTTVSFR